MAEIQTSSLSDITKAMRRWILRCTHSASSGHPTSSLSAVELMATLFFDGHFRYDADDPRYPNNDRLIFSKGHASPLFYALWCAAGEITEEDLMTYRQFDSVLEGHPTSRFRFTEAATGSLGQGLSIGVGMAMNAKLLDNLPYRTYVLLGDSEMAEGSQWEAMEIASYYQLNNLIGILDVNRLGQRGPTMYGHDLDVYRRRAEAFGWNTIVVPEGHNCEHISAAYAEACKAEDAPTMIIARTIKGKGISFLEDADGWHGKAVDDEKLEQALEELGEIPVDIRGQLARPQQSSMPVPERGKVCAVDYQIGDKEATRTAYGNALTRLGDKYPEMVVLDGEVSNSTKSEAFKEKFPERFFEMYIAEQNMVGTGLGMALRGNMPFVSTFAAFFSRAFDQIRMSRYSEPNIKFVGSHAGVEIGEDGPSQMALEDLAMFRSVLDSVVLYPCDAVSTEKCVELMADHTGISYLRTTRGKTPILYDNGETFVIGGSKVLRRSHEDQVTLIGAGVTLHEALKAHDQLKEEGIHARVIDLYSVKPLDLRTLEEAAQETDLLITIEDHFAPGGIGEAICGALSGRGVPIEMLCVHRRPRSGTSEELLDLQGISAAKIVEAVKKHHWESSHA